MHEMTTGARADLAVKLLGDDFDVLTAKAADVERVLQSVPGCVNANADQIVGQPVLQIKVRPDELARYGISARQVLDLVEALGSRVVGEVVEGQLRFPLVVRLPETSAWRSRRDRPGGAGRPDRANTSRSIDSPKSASSKGHPRSPANGASGASSFNATSAAETWAASWPTPRPGCGEKCSCPRAAIGSSLAASSSIWFTPANG